MIVAGFDSGVANFGYAVARYEPMAADRPLRFLEVGVWRTEKDASLSRTVDTAHRCCYLAAQLLDLATRHALERVAIEAVAFPVGRVQHSVISGLGRARGLVDCFAVVSGLCVEEFQTQALKQAVAGKRTASKQEVIGALEAAYPELTSLWPTPRGIVEHAADAAGAIVAYTRGPVPLG